MPVQRKAYKTGLAGEKAAEEALIDKGLTLVERRFRIPGGEIDLVMLDGDVLVFTEVKCRPKEDTFYALEAITPAKCRRLTKAASVYLQKHPEYASLVARFDVVTVSREGVTHIPGAFEAVL